MKRLICCSARHVFMALRQAYRALVCDALQYLLCLPNLTVTQVHMETCPPGQQEWRTVYHFKQPDDQERAECRLNSILERIPHARGPNSSRHLVDPDGDIDPPRRHGEGASTAGEVLLAVCVLQASIVSSCACYVCDQSKCPTGRNADQIVIHHHLATLLPSVGLQVTFRPHATSRRKTRQRMISLQCGAGLEGCLAACRSGVGPWGAAGGSGGCGAGSWNRDPWNPPGTQGRQGVSDRCWGACASKLSGTAEVWCLHRKVHFMHEPGRSSGADSCAMAAGQRGCRRWSGPHQCSSGKTAGLAWTLSMEELCSS